MKAEKTATLYEVGQITHLYKDYALISLLYSYNCNADCSSCKETCLLTTKTLRVKNTLHAKVGERVMLSMPDRRSFFLTLFYFVVPCFILLPVFSFAAFFLTNLWYVITGILLLFFVLFFLKIMDRAMRRTQKYQLTMVEILNYAPKNDRIDS